MQSIAREPGTSPHITVRVDVEQDINHFLYFLRTPSFRVKRSNILQFYPTMRERITQGEDEQTVVREMVTGMYQRYKDQVEQIVERTTREFSQANQAFTALARLMNFSGLNQRSYTAIPTFLPFSPLDQDRFFFSIAMTITRARSTPGLVVAIGIHEISHFLWREQYVTWRRQSTSTLSDPTYHYLKEALTAAIMDQPEFRKFFDYQRLFTSTSYPGNRELRHLSVNVRNQQMTMIEACRQSVLLCPDGYLTGLHRLCEACAAVNDEFDVRWKIWNESNGALEHYPQLLARYQQPFDLPVRS